MTSRDFGIVTLRNAVAYHFDGSIVPINNVYITSTNGAAIFSDSLTISTINVSTINGGGVGGGGVSSISSGINISITGTVSTPIVNVDINSTLLMNGFPIVDTTGLLTLSSIGGNISITTSLPGTSIVNNIELNNATGIAISTLGPAGAPISLPIALNASGDINLTAFGNINTYSFNNTTVAASNIINLSTLSTSIVLDQASQGITITANNDININASTLINGTIKVASTFYDNNASSGTSGQVLTAGTGGQVIWSTISGLPAPGLLTQLGTFDPTGALLTSTPFLCPADGWYLISADVSAAGTGSSWTVGTSVFSYYVKVNSIADVKSYMTQLSQLPGSTSFYIPQCMRYYNNGDTITPVVVWFGSPNLGSMGGITMYIQQMFS